VAPLSLKIPNTKRPKIILVANTAWYLYNFRKILARKIKASGFEPIFLAPPSVYSERLQAEGFKFIPYTLDRSGINPFKEFQTLLTLHKVYREEAPVLVHHFTIKCIILGTFAAFLARVPSTINAITGIGHFLIGESRRAKFLRPFITWLYASLMRLPGVKLIFQNPDDLRMFETLGIAKFGQSILIRSSGVDLKQFTPVEKTVNTNPFEQHSEKLEVLFAGRLLVEKGIRDFVEAAALIHLLHPEINFVVAGDQDPGNPSSISDIELAKWKNASYLHFLGHCEDMVRQIARADFVVLPSYREGVPKVLLEAAAMEKALIATNVPGCREVVDDGQNGILVEVKNPLQLAQAMETLIANPKLRKKMGELGREKISKEFSADAVAEATLQVYHLAPDSSNQASSISTFQSKLP
jgi:glycosyltransferase involved in cell wall biosynthesis